MKTKKHLWKRVVKWSLLTLLSLFVIVSIAVGVVIYFVFTPSKLTPLVEKTAREYLNADVHFGKIELTFFSTFPDFGLQMTDGTVVR